MRSSDWSSDVCSSDLKEPRARYFLAVKKDLAGEHRGAIDDWFALLADTPQGAPWEPDLRRTIEQVGAIHKIEVKSRLAKTQARPLTAEDRKSTRLNSSH